jgi:hypothetical protein
MSAFWDKAESAKGTGISAFDPLLTFEIGSVNGREARESGFGSRAVGAMCGHSRTRLAPTRNGGCQFDVQPL